MFRFVRFTIFGCLLALTACNPGTTPKTSVYEVTGSSAKRVAEVSAIITKHQAPPTAILDAYFLEEQIGDGILGPSDFRTFYVVEVAPQDVARWTMLLTPLEATAEYSAPAQPPAWWIAQDALGSLQFYKPDLLTGSANGWVGVEPQTGRIYVFTFTM